MLLLLLKVIGLLISIILLIYVIIIYILSGGLFGKERINYKEVANSVLGVISILSTIYFIYELCTEFCGDPTTQLSIATKNARLPEGDDSTKAFLFVANRRGDLDGDVFVDYHVSADGDADRDDFGGHFPRDRIQLRSGHSQTVIPILVTGDREIEPNEYFTVVLSNPTPDTALISSKMATGLILDDDAPPSVKQSFEAARDKGTTSALRQFVEDNPDGPLTQRAEKILNRHANLITSLQRRLLELNFYSGPVDGIAGPVTQESAERFSAWYGLPKPDLHRLDRGERQPIANLVQYAERSTVGPSSKDGRMYGAALPFLDREEESVVRQADLRQALDKAIEQSMRAYAATEPKFAVDHENHKIDRPDEEAEHLNRLFWLENSNHTEKRDKIVQQILLQDHVDVLVFGEYYLAMGPYTATLMPIAVSRNCRNFLYGEEITVDREQLLCPSTSLSESGVNADMGLCPPVMEKFKTSVVELLQRVNREPLQSRPRTPQCQPLAH